MTTKYSGLPADEATQPRVLKVQWHSGVEIINLDDIEVAREGASPPWSTRMTTHEQREGTGRIVIYESELKLHSNGFALRYKDEGYWADDDDMVQNAEGEKGQAAYSQYEDGSWKCFWYGDNDPDNPHEFKCEEVTTVREWRQTEVAVRNAKFRRNVLAAGTGCIVTKEVNPAVLDAAHICEVHGEGNDLPLNGLVMRKDIHWLYDRGIIKIDSNGKVTMKPILESYAYLFKDTLTGAWNDEPKIDNLEFRRQYIELRNALPKAKKKG